MRTFHYIIEDSYDDYVRDEFDIDFEDSDVFDAMVEILYKNAKENNEDVSKDEIDRILSDMDYDEYKELVDEWDDTLHEYFEDTAMEYWRDR